MASVKLASEPSTEITWPRTSCRAALPQIAPGSAQTFYGAQAKQQAGFVRHRLLFCTLPGARADAGTQQQVSFPIYGKTLLRFLKLCVVAVLNMGIL